MSFIRKKLVTVLLFMLITIGQAYPFSVAYGMFLKNKPAVCCCHNTEDRCHCPHQHSKKTITHSCHEEKSPGYKAMCGGKTQDEVLSFRTEPFLKNSIQVSQIFHKEFLFHDSLFLAEGYHTPPLSPPPKVSLALFHS